MTIRHRWRRPTRARVTGAIGCALFGVALGACHPVTQIVLTVDVDPALNVPMELNSVDLTVAGATQSPTARAHLGSLNDPTLPLTLGLLPAGALSPVTVTAAGLFVDPAAAMPEREVVRQQAIVAFVDGQSLLLELVLQKVCVGVSCGDGMTCVAGACVSAQRGGLPPWRGALPPRQMGTAGGRTLWTAGSHSCALDGAQVYCWGQNTEGQLGNGTTQTPKIRQAVANLRSPIAVGLGANHSCACDATAQAFCWGRNVEGQLGTGATSATPATRPTAVAGVTDCVQIAGGDRHTCVVHKGGTVSCWGSNTKGQLGLGAMAGTTAQPVPKLVPGLTAVAEIHAGAAFTCARRGDGTAWCWGENLNGQLGDGTNRDKPVPTQVTGLPAGEAVVELAASPQFACARLAGGQMMCWGDNGSGQLGTGGTTSSNVPVPVMDLADVIQMAGGGGQHSCAIRAGGVISCWGGNTFGQLGNKMMMTSSPLPANVMGYTAPATTVSAGTSFSCARLGTSSVACWGQNNFSQLGSGEDSTTIDHPLPVSVVGFAP